MTISLPFPAERSVPETTAQGPVPAPLPSSPTVEQSAAQPVEIEPLGPEPQPSLPASPDKSPPVIASERPASPPKPATAPARSAESPKPVNPPKPAITTPAPVTPPEPSSPAKPSAADERTQAKTEPTDSIVLPKIELIARAGSGSGYPSPAPPQAEAPNNSAWMVQAGSFSLEGNASRLRDRLRAQHFAASVERIMINGSPVYRVRIGPQTTQAESEEIRDRLQREAGIKGNVVARGG